MDRDAQFIFRKIPNNLMQFSPMSIKYRCLVIVWRGWLNAYQFAVVLVDVKTVILEINGQGTHFCGDSIISPPTENSPCIGAKGNYVSKRFQHRERVVNPNLMAC